MQNDGKYITKCFGNPDTSVLDKSRSAESPESKHSNSITHEGIMNH